MFYINGQKQQPICSFNYPKFQVLMDKLCLLHPYSVKPERNFGICVVFMNLFVKSYFFWFHVTIRRRKLG